MEQHPNRELVFEDTQSTGGDSGLGDDLYARAYFPAQ